MRITRYFLVKLHMRIYLILAETESSGGQDHLNLLSSHRKNGVNHMVNLGSPDTRKTFHVLYDSTIEQWKISYEGASMAFSAHANKREAVEAGRELAQSQQPSQLIIHKMDGSIQKEVTYEGD